MTFLPGLRQIELTELERRTFAMVLLAALCGGMIQAVMVIIPEVILKALHADKTYIVLVTLFWPVGQLVATYWSAYLDGKAQKSGVLRAVAVFGRLPLAFAALFDTVAPMLLFFLFMVISWPAVVNSQHAIVHSNFRPEVRGKLYSYMIGTMTLSSLLSALCYGFWLDANPENYRWILMLGAAAGAMEPFFLAKVHIDKPLKAVYQQAVKIRRSLLERVIRPWREFFQLFRDDPDFFRFEISFFVYGLGFMALQPFITIFLAGELGLSYTQIALSKSVILQAGVILTSPITGRIFDQKNPVLFGSYVFLLIAIFPVLMTVTGLVDAEHPEYMVYISYAILSIGWSGLTLLWNLGSMFFAQERDVSRYSGAHVVMVGIRGAIAMGVAVFIVDLIPPVVAFMATAVLWLSASLLMFWHFASRYKNPNDGEKPKPPPGAAPTPMPGMR